MFQGYVGKFLEATVVQPITRVLVTAHLCHPCVNNEEKQDRNSDATTRPPARQGLGNM